MKHYYSSKLIIIFRLIVSLHFLCMPKTSNAGPCTTTSCVGNISLISLPIKFPFRLVDHQAKSCGSPGFDVYCDHKLGHLLDLPNAGNFSIDALFYTTREIKLSDPNNCLPKKLLSLDLTTTPFRRLGQGKDFQVYNCSEIGDHNDLYDEIDCLKSSNYTVISVQSGVTVSNSNCKLLKIVSVPTRTDNNKLDSAKLSSYSIIHLTWNEQSCESCGKSESFTWTSPSATDTNSNSSEHRTLVAVVTTFVVLFLICVTFTLCILLSKKPAATSLNNTINYAVSERHSSTTISDVAGLDQTTINSYPMMVIGESGRQIKPEDDKCPICLTDYFPGDTLKILPECVHRFHAECIDPWLSAKASCPICRTFSSNNTLP